MHIEASRSDSKVVQLLKHKTFEMLEGNRKLKSFQDEIDRRLSKVPNQNSRQEVIDIMFTARKNELIETLMNINRLLDDITRKIGVTPS